MGLNEVKILHCADLHLGAEFSTLGDCASTRKRENFLAFERIVSLCKDEKVDFLLIAGDLFDHLHVENQLFMELIEQIKRIPETVVAIAPGNHDPFTVDSLYFARQWPANVIVFQGELSFIPVKNKNVCLWGGGFTAAYHPESFFEIATQNAYEDWIHLCVIHGDLIQTGQGSMYNPISREKINQSPFDYLALGHVHKRTTIQRENRTFYAYSGCPEGHGFDEAGEQGVYLGTISKGRCTLQFKRICTRCYEEVHVAIDHLVTSQEIADCIVKALQERDLEQSRNNLYKIVLTGEIAGTTMIDPEGISQRISAYCFFSKIEDCTTLAVDLETLSGEQTLKGIFVRKMLEKQKAAVDGNHLDLISKTLDALQYGLKAFDGEVTFHED